MKNLINSLGIICLLVCSPSCTSVTQVSVETSSENISAWNACYPQIRQNLCSSSEDMSIQSECMYYMREQYTSPYMRTHLNFLYIRGCALETLLPYRRR